MSSKVSQIISLKGDSKLLKSITLNEIGVDANVQIALSGSLEKLKIISKQLETLPNSTVSLLAPIEQGEKAAKETMARLSYKGAGLGWPSLLTTLPEGFKVSAIISLKQN